MTATWWNKAIAYLFDVNSSKQENTFTFAVRKPTFFAPDGNFVSQNTITTWIFISSLYTYQSYWSYNDIYKVKDKVHWSISSLDMILVWVIYTNLTSVIWCFCVESFPGVLKVGNFIDFNVLLPNLNFATLYHCRSRRHIGEMAPKSSFFDNNAFRTHFYFIFRTHFKHFRYLHLRQRDT